MLLSIANILYAQPKEKKELDTFLNSKKLKAVEKAYWKIVKNKEKYFDVIYKELFNCVKKTDHKNIPDKLIYLTAITKDKRYVDLLVKLINDKNYSYDACIYSCPIIFSLTIYSCFTEYFDINVLTDNTTPVYDLKSNVRYLNNIDFNKEVNSCVLSDSLIKNYLIDASLNNYEARHIAAEVLRQNIKNSTYLYDLYWLVINENYDDCEYRASIYNAIYMAEMARKNSK